MDIDEHLKRKRKRKKERPQIHSPHSTISDVALSLEMLWACHLPA